MSDGPVLLDGGAAECGCAILARIGTSCAVASPCGRHRDQMAFFMVPASKRAAVERALRGAEGREMDCGTLGRPTP